MSDLSEVFWPGSNMLSSISGQFGLHVNVTKNPVDRRLDKLLTHHDDFGTYIVVHQYEMQVVLLVGPFPRHQYSHDLQRLISLEYAQSVDYSDFGVYTAIYFHLLLLEHPPLLDLIEARSIEKDLVHFYFNGNDRKRNHA